MARIKFKEVEEVEGKSVEHFSLENVELAKYDAHAAGENVIFALGEFEIHSFRPTSAGPRGNFLPTKVMKDGVIFWSYEQEKEVGVKKLGFLFTHEDGFHLIAITSLGRLLKVVCLDTEPENLVQIMKDVAEARGFAYDPPMMLTEATASIRHLALIVTDSKKSDKIAAKQHRRKEILGRSKIVAARRDGSKISGIPVTEGEWQILPNATPVVLVEKVVLGVATGLIEAFNVVKRGSTYSKEKRCEVTEVLTPKEQHIEKCEDSEPQLFQMFEFKGQTLELEIVSGEMLAAMRSKQRLETGRRFAVSYKGSPRVLAEIDELGGVKTFGNLVPIS